MIRFSRTVGMVLLLFAITGCGDGPVPAAPTYKSGASGTLFIIEHSGDRFLLYDAIYASAMIKLDDDNPVQIEAVVATETDDQETFGNLFVITAGSQRFLLYKKMHASSIVELDR